MEYMPCGSFQANAVFFAIGVLTYNLYLGFPPMRLEADGSIRKCRPCAGGCFRPRARSCATQIFLQIGAAMLDMFAAIRERCARIMREGGAIPETS
jgi:hypothetical protein